MGQFGGASLGGAALSASTMTPQDFRALPHDAISKLMLNVNFSAKSSASAFNCVVSTASSAAAEGVDDLDLILNALFSLLTMFWDEETMAFSLTPAQLRTVLGLFNKRDFDGTFLNATSIPVSTGAAKAFTVAIVIPVSLRQYFEDGDIFRNGARRLSGGSLQYSVGSSLTPSVVCANGTAVISAVSVNIYAFSGAGTEDDVGNVWKVERKAGIATTYEFDTRQRLALLDASTVAANAVSKYNIGPFGLIDPNTLGAKYQADRIPDGGFDITARVTPLLWMEPWRKFLDLQATLGQVNRIEAVSGVSSLTLYDILAVPPTPEAVQRVAQRAGAGGPVTIQHPSPSSLPPGTAIPAELVHQLPIRIAAGSRAPTGGTAVHAANPAVAANRTIANRAFGQRVQQLFAAVKKQ